MSMMSTFKRAEVFIVPTDQVCRRRKQVEILSLQWTILIGEQEFMVCIRPSALPIRFAGSVELVVHASSDNSHRCLIRSM